MVFDERWENEKECEGYYGGHYNTITLANISNCVIF